MESNRDQRAIVGEGGAAVSMVTGGGWGVRAAPPPASLRLPSGHMQGTESSPGGHRSHTGAESQAVPGDLSPGGPHSGCCRACKAPSLPAALGGACPVRTRRSAVQRPVPHRRLGASRPRGWAGGCSPESLHRWGGRGPLSRAFAISRKSPAGLVIRPDPRPAEVRINGVARPGGGQAWPGPGGAGCAWRPGA